MRVVALEISGENKGRIISSKRVAFPQSMQPAVSANIVADDDAASIRIHQHSYACGVSDLPVRRCLRDEHVVGVID